MIIEMTDNTSPTRSNETISMKRKSSDGDDDITLVDVQYTDQELKKTKVMSSAEETTEKTDKNNGKITEKQRSKDEERRLKEERRLQEKKLKEEEKLRKLEEKEQEKRRKEDERAREKRLKEEEKEKEKRRKEEEKELEKKRKEQAREEEKKRKEEQRLMKEQEKKQKEDAIKAEKKKKQDRENRSQMSLGKFFSIETRKEHQEALSAKSQETKASSYKAYFLPFHVKSNTKLAFCQLATADDEGDIMKWIKSHKVKRGRAPLSTARDLMGILNEKALDEDVLAKEMEKIPCKYLYFHEDVRPPFIGSFSKYLENVALNPFERVANINYDYDSEVEWVQDDEEGDGEDIGEEDSEDNADDDEDDMDGFLDEESDEVGNRRQIIGPLKVSLICNDGSDPEVFRPMELQCMIPTDGQIDPFKNYWTVESPVKSLVKSKKSEKALRTVPQETLPKVLQTVHGSDMSLILLIEIVKREFPKLSKESIRNTIKSSATQQGQKDQKRWHVNDQYRQYLRQEIDG